MCPLTGRPHRPALFRKEKEHRSVQTSGVVEDMPLSQIVAENERRLQELGRGTVLDIYEKIIRCQSESLTHHTIASLT